MKEASEERLDASEGHVSGYVMAAPGWLRYLVGRLPSEEHAEIARAMYRGDHPIQYEDQRKVKEAKCPKP